MVKIKKTSEAFKSGPQNMPPRFFLAFGPDNGFVSDAVNSLANELIAKTGGLEVKRVYDSDLASDFLGFESSISNASLFGGAVIAIVRLSNESNSAKIIDLLERVEAKKAQIDGACYFECGDFSTKSKLVQAFENSQIASALRLYPPSKAEFVDLAKECAIAEGVQIDNPTTELIIESGAQDSLSVRAQIRSLALFVGKGGRIDEAAFAAVNENVREAGIDEVLAAAFSGEPKMALLRAHQCLIGDVNPIVLLNQFLRRLKTLLLLRKEVDAGKTPAEVVEDKRNGVFWKEKTIIAKQLNIWSRSALESVLSKAINTDIECKKRGANMEALVENMILGISEYAANRR